MNIYERPLNKRPPIGTRPSFLDDEHNKNSALHNKLSIIKNAYLNERKNASSYLDDYFNEFSKDLASFSISLNEFTKTNVDEIVDARIVAMTPLQNNLLEFR